MTNADRSPTFFRFDPAEQLALYKEMDATDEEIVVVYHSHTSTEAYPSRTDISYAAEPQAHYLLVSVAETGADEGPAEVRSYRILDGVVTEEEIEITSADPAADRNNDRRCGGCHTSNATDRPPAPDQRRRTDEETTNVAVEVRIPTILRTYTQGEKAVQGDGATLAQVIDDVEGRYPGLKARLVDESGPAPLRQRVRQRRGRPVHRWTRGPDRRR